jgi:hypothetical protein
VREMTAAEETMLEGLMNAFWHHSDRRDRAFIETRDYSVAEQDQILFWVLDVEEAQLVRDALDPTHPRAALLRQDLGAALAAYDREEPPIPLPETEAEQ